MMSLSLVRERVPTLHVPPISSAPVEQVELSSIASGLRRRLFGIMFTIGAALVVATLLIALLPRSYQAQTKILVRVGREQVAPLEDAGTRFGNFILSQRAETTNDEVEMLRRPQLMQVAFPKLAALLAAREAETQAPPDSWTSWRRDLGKRVEEIWSPARRLLEDFGVLTRETEAERLRRQFTGALDVATVRETNILILGFTWNDPVFAAEALNVFAETYRTEHVRLQNNVKGMADLFQAQAARTEAELSSATRELDDYLLTQGSSDPAAERQLLISRIQSLEQEANDATTARQQISKQIETFRARFADTKDWPETPSLGGAALAGLSDIDAKHVDLLVARDRLLTQFRSEARQVQDIEGQLMRLRQTKFDALQHSLETRQAAEDQRLALAKEQITQSRGRFETLTRIQHRVAELQDRRDQLISQLKTYRAQAEYLVLQEALNEKGLASVTVLGQASPPDRPTAPRKPVIFGLSFALSAMLAVGYAALAELRDTKLRDASQVRSVMRLPVLATVHRE